MMINNVVPARAGEFARAYALSRSTPAVPFPAAFASLAVDRLFDAVVVFGLMFGAMLDPAFPRGAQFGGRPLAEYAVDRRRVIGVVLVARCTRWCSFPRACSRCTSWSARRLAPRSRQRGRDALLASSPTG